MTIPKFTFKRKNPFTFQWTLTDQTGAPINSATVTATLYANRSATNPDDLPGTPVTGFNNVSLPYVAASAGIYQVAIPATFNPPSGQDYVLVIDARLSGSPIGHWEEPSAVAENQ